MKNITIKEEFLGMSLKEKESFENRDKVWYSKPGAIDPPVLCDCFGNTFESVEAMCDFYNVPQMVLHERLMEGWGLKRALFGLKASDETIANTTDGNDTPTVSADRSEEAKPVISDFDEKTSSGKNTAANEADIVEELLTADSFDSYEDYLDYIHDVEESDKAFFADNISEGPHETKETVDDGNLEEESVQAELYLAYPLSASNPSGIKMIDVFYESSPSHQVASRMMNWVMERTDRTSDKFFINLKEAYLWLKEFLSAHPDYIKSVVKEIQPTENIKSKTTSLMSSTSHKEPDKPAIRDVKPDEYDKNTYSAVSVGEKNKRIARYGEGISVEINYGPEEDDDKKELDFPEELEVKLPNITNVTENEIPLPDAPTFSDKDKFEEYLKIILNPLGPLQKKFPSKQPIIMQDMFDPTSPRYEIGQEMLSYFQESEGFFDHKVHSKKISGLYKVVFWSIKYFNAHPNYKFTPQFGYNESAHVKKEFIDLSPAASANAVSKDKSEEALPQKETPSVSVNPASSENISEEEKCRRYLKVEVPLFGAFKKESKKDRKLIVQDFFDIAAKEYKFARKLMEYYAGNYAPMLPEECKEARRAILWCKDYLRKHKDFVFEPKNGLKISTRVYPKPNDNSTPMANKLEMYLDISFPALEGYPDMKIVDAYDPSSPHHAEAKDMVMAYCIDGGTKVQKTYPEFSEIVKWCQQQKITNGKKVEVIVERYKVTHKGKRG